VALSRYWKTRGRDYREVGSVPSQVTRRSYNGQADGEIMFARGLMMGEGIGMDRARVLFFLGW
jgi:hypothetical protein